MAGTAFLNKGLILHAVRDGLREGLDEAGDVVAAEARRRAPIRKVFRERKGFRRKYRPLTDAERKQAIDRAEKFYSNDEFRRRRAVAHLRYYARVQLPRRGSANSLAASRSTRILGRIVGGRFQSTSGAFPNRKGGFEPGTTLRPKLTSRGAYEVRSGRAIHYEATNTAGTHSRVQVGGALKASIENEGVSQTPTGMKSRVVAAIDYAKFVEFPTIRTAAQPFLLPALHQERGHLTRRLAAAIRKNIGG